MHLFSMNHVLDRVVIQMDMYNINIVSDLRTVYHDTNSMIFFTSAEMHISTRAGNSITKRKNRVEEWMEKRCH